MKITASVFDMRHIAALLCTNWQGTNWQGPIAEGARQHSTVPDLEAAQR
ncbi:hypothetical protein ABIF97_000944 [Bradyrhizobium japonicum]